MKATPVVLVVDDDPSDIELITRAFRKSGLGCEVHGMTSSVQALKYLEGQAPYSDPTSFPFPSLVTLDSKMPESGKWEVLVWIRQQPDLHKLPVVIICGSGDPADKNLALDLGANAFYVKPQDFEEFSRTITGIAEKWLVPSKG